MKKLPYLLASAASALVALTATAHAKWVSPDQAAPMSTAKSVDAIRISQASKTKIGDEVKAKTSPGSTKMESIGEAKNPFKEKNGPSGVAAKGTTKMESIGEAKNPFKEKNGPGGAAAGKVNKSFNANKP